VVVISKTVDADYITIVTSPNGVIGITEQAEEEWKNSRRYVTNKISNKTKINTKEI
jgi:hypothetical protein